MEENNKSNCNSYGEIDSIENKSMIEYMSKLKSINEEYYRKTGKRKSAITITFGCQMNEHDSEKIAWILESIGYEIALSEKEADFIIYNTCAVRKNAEDKVLGKLGELKRLKRLNSEMIIAVCGCMTQIQDTADYIQDKFRHVNIIFGTNNIHKLPEFILNYVKTKKTVVDLAEVTELIENVDANRLHDYKAFINIMYGCNNFCSYCIVPYTRGREVSREPNNIIEEVKKLAENGTKEVTLLGQNVNSYGKSLKSLNGDYTFTDLLRDLNNIDGIERIRFMTSHPKDISDELINAFGTLEKLCPHLHLPVQSGSNRILELMNRKYTVEDYLTKIEKIREINPNIEISTDLIIGFPGETEDDFQETIELIRKVKYDSAFTFLYSVREGTPAAKSKDQVPENVKRDRFNRLMSEMNPIAFEKNQKYVGQTVSVLVEDVSKNNNEVLTGRTIENKIVNFPGDINLIGKIVDVKIFDARTFTLEGNIE